MRAIQGAFFIGGADHYDDFPIWLRLQDHRIYNGYTAFGFALFSFVASGKDGSVISPLLAIIISFCFLPHVHNFF